MSRQPGRLSLIALSAFSAPALPMFALMMPLIVFIPPYYAEHMGLGMAAVGTVFLIGRTFDAVTDPLAGILIDKTQNVVSRKAWVMLGAPPILLATWQIFFAGPPGDATLFAVWILVLYAGWTLMSVGLYSWAGEAAGDYNERSRVMGAIQMANSIGTIGVLLVPVLFELSGTEGDISVLRVQAMGAFVLTALPAALLYAWFFAPASAPAEKPGNIRSVFRRVVHNPALIRLLLADFLIGLKIGVTTALSVFFIEIVAGLPGRASTLQLVLLTSSLLAIPGFVVLSARIEKHRALLLSAGIAALAGALVLIAEPGAFWLIAFAYVLFGMASGPSHFLIRSIMADVADADRIATGSPSTGFFFSLLTTTLKLSLTLGVTVTFWVAAWLGFDPATARTDDSAHWVVRTLYGAIPILAVGLLALCIWRFPLTRAGYEEIRRSGEVQVA